MRKLGLITALFALLFSSFTGCDNSPLDKKVKEEAKRKEKEKNWNRMVKNRLKAVFLVNAVLPSFR